MTRNFTRILALTLVMALGFFAFANSAFATLTLNATSITSDGNYTVNGVAASVYNFGAATTTGTMTFGGTAMTGNIVLGSSSAASSVLIGNGAGASTVSIANAGTAGNTVNIAGAAVVDTATDTVNIAGGNAVGGTSGGKTVNIANGTPGTAATNTINIGSGGTTTGLVSITLGSNGAAGHTTAIKGGNGASAITLSPAAAGGIQIGTASQTGTITLGQSTATNTISIGAGNTAAGATQTINIGSGTPVTTGLTSITIGNTFANSNAPASTVNLYGKLVADCGTGTASANAVTIQKQCGVITSSTSTLAAATSETITLTDARIAATNIILATINGACTGGNVVVENAVAGAGTATIAVRNVNGTTACSTTYKVGFLILSQ